MQVDQPNLGSKPRRERKIPPRFQDEEQWDINNSVCTACFVGGDLLCCTTCTLVYHLDCLTPPLTAVPEGDWFCPFCVQRGSEPAPKRQRVTPVGDQTLHCPMCVRSFAQPSGFEKHMLEKHASGKMTSGASDPPVSNPIRSPAASTSTAASTAASTSVAASVAAPAPAVTVPVTPAAAPAAASATRASSPPASDADADAAPPQPDAEMEPPLAPPVVWEEALSPEGVPYFYNRETKVSSWRRPEGANVVIKPHKSKLLAAGGVASAGSPGVSKTGTPVSAAAATPRTTPTGRDSRATSPTRAAALMAAKVYHCAPCDKSFISEPGLLQHMTKMHKDEGLAVQKVKDGDGLSVATTKATGKKSGTAATTLVATPTSIVHQEIVAAFKDCLKYMRPPTWSMSNAEIDSLDVNGLRYFPLKQFLDQYSGQMDSYVKSRVEDAEVRATEASAALATARAQCATLRTEVAVLRAQLGGPPAAAIAATAIDATADSAVPTALQDPAPHDPASD